MMKVSPTAQRLQRKRLIRNAKAVIADLENKKFMIDREVELLRKIYNIPPEDPPARPEDEGEDG